MSTSNTHLLWMDIETDGLADVHDGVIDYSPVNLLEMGAILTDRDLNIEPVGGYSEVLKMTSAAADRLRADDFVRNMHIESGLIKESIAATATLESVDADLDAFLTDSGAEPGRVTLAGSGVAHFDHGFVQARMPRTSRWLTYYTFDVGVFRRVILAMAGGPVANPKLDSYGTKSKVHRAMADVEAHLREAQGFRDWVRKLPPF